MKRSEVSAAALALTPQMRIDLLRFQRVKRWRAEALALLDHVAVSTAWRRLQKLIAVGVVMKMDGRPLPVGGREPDMFYLSPLGARVITRLLNLGGSYIEAPDVSNPVINRHDLTVGEVAARTGVFDQIAIYMKRTLASGDVVIPDLFAPRDQHLRALYFEIEATTRPEHIAGKYERYGRTMKLFDWYHVERPELIVIFPDEETHAALLPAHRDAAIAAGVENDDVYAGNLAEIRAHGVVDMEGAGGNGVPRRHGMMDFVYSFIDVY